MWRVFSFVLIQFTRSLTSFRSLVIELKGNKHRANIRERWKVKGIEEDPCVSFILN